MELVPGVAPVVAYDVVFGVDVGAAVVHAVERHACTELVAEVIHRGEVESQNRVGIRRGILLVAHFDAFAPPRAEEREVVAEMARECGADRPRGHFGRLPSEIVGQARAQSHGVESRVGEFGVAVRKVGHRKARGEFQPLREQPVEVEIDVEVGVDPRPHHDVGAVVVRVVRFPSERQAEIPLVVERYQRADACDARALEEVDGNRVAQLPAVAEAVIGDPNSLVYAAVDTVGARPGAEAERITQVGGQRALDRLACHVGSGQKDVRRGNVLRAELRADAVDEPPPPACRVRGEGGQ